MGTKLQGVHEGGAIPAGAGTISFAPNSDATLIFDAASLPANMIIGFAVGDTIIMTGFTYAVTDSYVVNAAR